ncbi:MAG: CPBP family intramembrane glutamic endopeptidase [Nocardioides sp.]
MSHTDTIRTTPDPTTGRAPRPGLIERHPLLTFSVAVITATWTVQLTFLAIGLPLFAALLIELVILVGAAVTITRRISGRAGARELLSGVTRWRFGLRWYALVLVAMPVMTLLVAWATGTLDAARSEWVGAALTYVFVAVVYGALLGNMWEELGWTGFLQSRLMDHHGVFTGSMITAVPFALIHLPLVFEADGLGGTSLRDVVLGVLVLAGAAPFLRYLIGVVFTRTGGSLLAVALLHGSFNAGASTTLVEGGWEYIVALVVLTSVVAVGIRVREGRWS